jgi:hypothetical protein
MELEQANQFRAALLDLKSKGALPANGGKKTGALNGATPERIEAALRRLEQGSYGYCRSCFLVIPSAELLRRPYAERCVRCQARENTRQDRK